MDNNKNIFKPNFCNMLYFIWPMTKVLHNRIFVFLFLLLMAIIFSIFHINFLWQCFVFRLSLEALPLSNFLLEIIYWITWYGAHYTILGYDMFLSWRQLLKYKNFTVELEHHLLYISTDVNLKSDISKTVLVWWVVPARRILSFFRPIS